MMAYCLLLMISEIAVAIQGGGRPGAVSAGTHPYANHRDRSL